MCMKRRVFYVQELSEQLSVKCAEFKRYKNSGICNGEMLPQNQLGGMLDRFDKLTVEMDRQRKKTAYELSRNQLLMCISSTESRLKTWSAKYGGRQSIEALLTDHEVLM